MDTGYLSYTANYQYQEGGEGIYIEECLMQSKCSIKVYEIRNFPNFNN